MLAALAPHSLPLVQSGLQGEKALLAFGFSAISALQNTLVSFFAPLLVPLVSDDCATLVFSLTVVLGESGPEYPPLRVSRFQWAGV